jgi:hypothetical protein
MTFFSLLDAKCLTKQSQVKLALSNGMDILFPKLS